MPFDEQVARRILEALDSQFPKPTTSVILKSSKQNFADVSHENWLLALDGLQRLKQIEGKPYVTGANHRFNGIVDLRITQLGKDALASAIRESQRSIRVKNKTQFQSIADTYTVSGLKGQGGSGSVYEVTDSDGQRLALKHLRSDIPTKTRKRFLNEIEFCRQAYSDHIVRVLDSGRCDDGSVFYLMPFYPRTLQETIDAGIAPEKVLPVFGQLLDGVEAAHLLGVCHRDIKPANFLCDANCNQVVLADFEIADLKEDELYTLGARPKISI